MGSPLPPGTVEDWPIEGAGQRGPRTAPPSPPLYGPARFLLRVAKGAGLCK